MRLIAVMSEKTDADITWNYVNQGIWAVVEADVAIISGMYVARSNKQHDFTKLMQSYSRSMPPNAATSLDGYPAQALHYKTLVDDIVPPLQHIPTTKAYTVFVGHIDPQVQHR